MQDIEIYEANTPGDVCLEAINRLIRQLSPSSAPLTQDGLLRIVGSAASRLFVATVGGQAAGMCTLATYESPTGRKAWIEDVVVDAAFRGAGIGRRLVAKATDEARRQAPCTLMLTSRPTRVAANALYKSEGFEPKTTNVYRKKL